MNSVTKLNEPFSSKVDLKPRCQHRKNPMQPNGVCIARWEDDGGRTLIDSRRRRALVSINPKAGGMRSNPSASRTLMDFASNFWGHAASETILPVYGKIVEA